MHVTEGDSIELTSPLKLLPLIQKEAPNSKYQWTLNGLILLPELGNIQNAENNSLFINRATVNESGIYMLVLYRITKQKTVLKVVAVTVQAKTPYIDTRVSYDFKLKCHGVVLGI